MPEVARALALFALAGLAEIGGGWLVWQWLRAKQLPPPLARYEKNTPPACGLETEQMPSLFERFNQVKDWRQCIGKRHRLATVLAIIALAALSGVAQGYRAVSRFAKRLTKLQRRQSATAGSLP